MTISQKIKERDKLKNCIKGVAVLLLSVLLVFGIATVSDSSGMQLEEPTTTGSTLITEVTILQS